MDEIKEFPRPASGEASSDDNCHPFVRQDNYSMDRPGGPPGREEAGPPGGEPTASITWVIKNGMLEFGIDYLAITFYSGKFEGLELYSEILADYLGDLDFTGSSRFYEEQYRAGAGFYFQCLARAKNNRIHFRFILPGEACKIIPMEKLQGLIDAADRRGIKWNCTRLDIKIDHCPFKPLEIAKDIEEGRARTFADIKTLKKFDQPLEEDELGNIGTSGIYLGKRESDRYLRIYDKHGFTRFELECKGDFAHEYFKALIRNTDKFCDLSMGYALDFIEVDTDYWREFSSGYSRAYMKATEFQDRSLDEIKRFLLEQCSSAFSIAYDIEGEKFLQLMLKRGRMARDTNARYGTLVHAYGLEGY